MLGNKQIPLICLFLAVAALMAFWQLNQCDFISYDDSGYVTENIHIRNGITTEAIRWAFTTGYIANWHPLTWMSHMLDVQLFGLKPRWHHLTNLLFHIANTLLLFFVFNRMTKAPWKSAFVAALFALHPLHVESVAWVAERKDVLSTFFWMLTIVAYIHYVEHRTEDGRRRTEDGRRRTEDGRQRTEDGEKWTGIFRPLSYVLRYLAVLIFFTLGLMAKPMLVTLPFVLLLLDFWPLQRMQGAGSREQGARSEKQNPKLGQEPLSANKRKSPKKPTDQVITQSSVLSASSPGSDAELYASRPASIVNADANKVRVPQSFALRPLLLEKIPLFALAALSCIVTFIVQKKGGALRSTEVFSPGVRIANAFVSYIIYMGKTIWPTNLALYYPHPGLWPLWQVLGAVFLLGAVTLTVIRTTNRFPYLTVGWMWFTSTLVPVIGIVQVGDQAMADRYTYIPLIGLFVMAAWGIPELLKKWRYRKETLFASSSLLLLSLFIVTRTQVGYWRNNFTLYDHSLEVSPSHIMYCNRGVAYEALGNHRQAISDYEKAIELAPGRTEPYNNRGIAYDRLGNHRQAISDYNRAIEIYPEYAAAYGNRGTAYSGLGEYRQAISDFDRATEINPELAWAYNGRGMAYGKLGNHRQAISDFDRAIEIKPEYAEPYNNRGVVYDLLGNNRQAISDYDRAVEIDPDYADAYYNRGVAYAELGDHRQAISDYDRAIEIKPDYADAYNNRGVAYARFGNRSQAIEDLQKAARLDNKDAKNSLRSIGISW
ncbi:MAG: tetratricopeptide repeat protein [Syntrophobacteraceae bacterium]